jgi:hypothetical protein
MRSSAAVCQKRTGDLIIGKTDGNVSRGLSERMLVVALAGSGTPAARDDGA